VLQIRTIVSQPFDENTYLVWLEGRTDALVVDPGLEPDLIIDCLREHGLSPAAILDTHGHADHIAGNREMKRLWPAAPLLIGEYDAEMLTDAVLNLSGPFGMPLTSPPADRLLKDGEVLTLAGIELEVRHVPGHSPGHVVFVLRGTTPTVVLGGDVLFRGGVGRYDFPGGDGEALFAGIRSKLFGLPDDTVVYPGHGPVTTTGREKATNPYLS
jgi:glyoxylase-like metal-dependent hydrolase (beta-lactamase superfamily II)